MSDFDSDDFGDHHHNSYLTDDETDGEYEYSAYNDTDKHHHRHHHHQHQHQQINEINLDSIDTSKLKNYLFYTNKLKSNPDGDLLSVIHKTWKNNYNLLEDHHGYIQWIFPLFVGTGVNYHAYKLEYIEAKIFREDFEIAKKILKSYQMMLNFYGMELHDIGTGEIKRSSDLRFQKDRYRNLSNNTHNNLRISRMITFLGHVGLQRYKSPLIKFLEKEIMSRDLIISKYSLEKFWKPLIDYRDMKEYFQSTAETKEHLEHESILFKKLNEINENDDI